MNRPSLNPYLAGLVMAATLASAFSPATAGRIPDGPLIHPAPGPTSDSLHVESNTDTDSGNLPLYNTSLLVFRPTQQGGYLVGQTVLTTDNSSGSDPVIYSEISLDTSLLRPEGTGSPYGFVFGDFAYAILGRYQVEIPAIAPDSETGVVVGISPSTSGSLRGKEWHEAFATAPTIAESSVFYALTSTGVTLSSMTVGFLDDLYALSPKYPGVLGSAGGPDTIVLNLMQFSTGFGAGTVTLTAAAVPEAGTWAAGVGLLALAGFGWFRRSRQAVH
jgi:hypothetical protein